MMDMDYALQKEFNCCLINLEDMLQNGTVISKTKIDKPHSFSVACNIAMQIIAQATSNQFGGISASLTHLAPFVDISRKKFKKEIIKEFNDNNIPYNENQINNIAESRVLKEIEKGVQTIQYQVVTLTTQNGKAPFLSVFMYLGEAKDEQTKKDLALIIKEVLKQRIQGIKNEKGTWITPAFPKLLYVLEPDNIKEDSKYWYLTKLAAECTAKRMVPDFISEKVMKELKDGNCYPCMGCVDGREVIDYMIENIAYVEDFETAWNRINNYYKTVTKYSKDSEYITTEDVKIYDTFSSKYVPVKKFIRNKDQGRWYRVEFNGPSLYITEDHPLPTQRGRVKAKDLQVGDIVQASNHLNFVEFNKQYEKATEYKVIKITYLGNRNRYEYDVETESDHFDVSGINSHNCRSFLSTGCLDEDGNEKFYGRFNIAVCTINLPHVALSSERNYDKFWKIFDKRLEMIKRVLLIKQKRLLGTKAEVSPIHWMYGGISRLGYDEVIDKLLYAPYSTISLGYAGLYETVLYMTGKSHTDPSATEFALDIMKYMNNKVSQWKKETNIGFAVYGTPIESTSYKFAKSLQRDFGKGIKGITDKNYVTNSYHVTPSEEIDAFAKLEFEAKFQKYSLGGTIQYIEIADLTKNIDAVLEIIKSIYENNMYAELNTRYHWCQKCGYQGNIPIIENENNKLIFECPQCGNTDTRTMNLPLRVCGYISSNQMNQGRLNDIKDRVYHL